MNRKNCLIVFVRNPEMGKVKTRIGTEIGLDKAFRIYTELLQYTFGTIGKLAVDISVFVADTDKFTVNQDYDFNVFRQQGADLGERMQHSFKTTFDKGYAKAVIVGSDNYEITPGIINEAFEALNSVDCVIGPAFDGGYYLLGMKNEMPVVFENIAWSTNKTLAQTIAVLEKNRYTYTKLTTLNDVDTMEDIKRYKRLNKIIES